MKPRILVTEFKITVADQAKDRMQKILDECDIRIIGIDEHVENPSMPELTLTCFNCRASKDAHNKLVEEMEAGNIACIMHV